MNTLDNYITDYLEHCEYRKRLNAKTIKAFFHYMEYREVMYFSPLFFEKWGHFLQHLYKTLPVEINCHCLPDRDISFLPGVSPRVATHFL